MTDAAIVKAFEVWKVIAAIEDSPALASTAASEEGQWVKAFVRAIAEQHPNFKAFEARRVANDNDAGATVH